MHVRVLILSITFPLCFSKVDVSSFEEVQQTAKEVVAQFGGIDILINNAGFIWSHAVHFTEILAGTPNSFHFTTSIPLNPTSCNQITTNPQSCYCYQNTKL